jgi:glycosyltransferase involved in cell wall biosynthesis
MSAVPHIIHIPMPLALSGSSLTNVVRDLSREHAAVGGPTTVVMSHNRPGDVADAEVIRVDYTRYCPREFFTRTQYAVDMLAGTLGLERPYGGRLFIPAIEAVATTGADWVFLHEGHYAAAALPRLRNMAPNARIALHVHNNLSRTYSKRELRRLLRHCDIIIAVSDHMAQHIRERLGSSRYPIVTLHNGVDHKIFTPRLRPPLEGRALRLLYGGQVAPHKGVHVLLEALALQSEINFEVRIVGSAQHGDLQTLSEYEEVLRALAAGLPIKVEFRPFAPREELADEFGWADVVVVPTLTEEPFGLVLLEAMATGAAVVSSDRGGLREAAAGAAQTFDGSANDLARVLSSLTATRVGELARKASHRARTMTWSQQYRKLMSILGSIDACPS